MFSPKECSLLDKMLGNPLRKEIGEASAGEVVYQDNRPVAFQGAILRRLYLGQEPMVGIVGSTLAAKRDTSPVMLMRLMRATIAPRAVSRIFFANTANATSQKMNRLLGVKGIGPATCERIRVAFTYVPQWLSWLCPRPHARRLMSIDGKVFDDFWSRYLASNNGIVSSRSSKELAWMFGDRLASGEVVFLGEFIGDALVGYIALRSSCGGTRWLIVDWIAIGNDVTKLESLLQSAVRFLRRTRGAVFLKTIGFPDFAEPIIRKHLRFSRKTPNNSFLWKFLGEEKEITATSWFFGPYDGDRCL